MEKKKTVFWQKFFKKENIGHCYYEDFSMKMQKIIAF